jgi:hypothetical protein
MITGTYNLAVSSEWRNLQEGEVFLECDTTLAPVTINLFEIAELQRFWNVKIVVSDPNNNAGTNNITINAGGSDTMDDSSTVQIVLNGNGESVALQVVSETQWLASESVGGGGGSTAPIEIFYPDLYDKIVNSQLIAGSKYRLLNYQSVNFLNGWQIANSNPTPIDPNFKPRKTYKGTDEILILEAISNYQLSPIAYSENYPQDILEYQGYTNTIGVDIGGIYNGQTLPDSSTVSGFDLQWDATNEVVYFDMPTGYPALFGHYFTLYAEFNGGSGFQDGVFEPLTPVISRCQYDFNSVFPMSNLAVSPDGMRVVLLDLSETDVNNYDVGTLYVNTVYSLGNAYGWVTKRTDTQRNISVPFDFRNRKYRRYEVDLTPVNPALGLGYWGQGDVYLGQSTTGNYIDVPSFGQDGYETYDIQWEGMGGADMNWYAGFCDNNVFLGTFFYSDLKGSSWNNTIGNSFYFNTTGKNFTDNTIGDDFQFNTIGNVFIANTIGSVFIANTIGNAFAGNTIGDSFENNTIGDSFKDNFIGDSFQVNSLGSVFTANTIGNVFQANFIGNDFQSNIIAGNFQSNSLGSAIVGNTIGDVFTANTIGNIFSSNTIGNSFQANFIGNDFQANFIGDDFRNNTIRDDFRINTIGNSFSSNTIGHDFTSNTIVNDFRTNQIEYSPTSTDFTLATHVYGDYNCTIFKSSASTLKLSYVDATNTVIYTAPNA